MGAVEGYMCDNCNKYHETREKLIWADTIGIDGDYHECLCFCDKKCLKEWIDEVL